MIKTQTKISDIKKSNLIYLVEKIEDLKILDFLELDKKTIIKITETLNSWEKENSNSKLCFFIWNKHFENIFIYFYNKKSKKTLIEYLWEEFPKLPNNLTILSNKDSNLLDIIDVCILSRYKFLQYKTNKKEKEEDEINIFIDKKSEKIVKDRLKTIENIVFARDLTNTPPNYLFPKTFVDIIKKIKFKNIKIKILWPKEIEKKGFCLLNAVWKASINKPYIVILEKITNKKKPTYWIVWKWVTIDTGWIQLKPNNYIYEMKWDMAWAATVLSIMKELDEKNLNINIIACLCLAENSISWEWFNPSDIYTAYNKKTVDIIDTDAEWRLVLADGISYISKNYKLTNIITVATLTWAVMHALWFRYAWIIWNDKKLINKFLDYSEEKFEKYVKLPFDNYFIEKTKSEIADLQNITSWIKAWPSMWAAFLYNFIENNEDFTHIDIAWTAINSYEPYWLFNKWMTWFWVDSISKILLDIK